MSTDLIVAKIDQARALLAEAKDATAAKRVADMAHAAEVYARRQKLSDEAIHYAREIRVEAEALLGEFIKASPKNTGARGIGKSAVPDGNHTPKLEEIGITKKESSRAQFIAEVKAAAPKDFEAYKHGEKSLATLRRCRKPKTPPKVKTIVQPISEPADVMNGLVLELWTFIDGLVKKWPKEIDIAVLADGLRNYADGIESRTNKKRRQA